MTEGLSSKRSGPSANEMHEPCTVHDVERLPVTCMGTYKSRAVKRGSKLYPTVQCHSEGIFRLLLPREFPSDLGDLG